MDEQAPAADVPATKPKKKREFTEKARVQQRIRRSLLMVQQAPEVVKQRKCRAKNAAGNPCGKYAIKGGSVCPTHGGSAPQVKKRAALRLLAMVEPALVELQEVVMQNVHLPSKVAAIRTVLERAGDEAIGALKQKVADQDSRPVINIGIKVGGIDKPIVSVGMLPKPNVDIEADVQEGEIVGDDETDD